MAITESKKTPDFTTDSLIEVMRAQIVALQELALNYVLTVAPALTIGSSSKADIRVNVAVDYVRDGQRRTQKAAAEVDVPAGATMADDGTARQVCVLVYIDTSDNFTALAGTVATGGATATVPSLPAGCVQLGYARIAAAAGTAFTANTTLLDAANITTTFVNELTPQQNMLVPVRKTL